MDRKNVKRLAEEFESVAKKYESDCRVHDLHSALEDLLSRAKAGSIVKYVDHVPGEYFFQEGDLSKYADLEAAYSKLKMALITEDKQYDELRAWAEKRKRDIFDKK